MRPHAERPSRVRLTCPACLKRGTVPSRLAGREVRCRRCQECFEVPASQFALGVAWTLEEPLAPPHRRGAALGSATVDAETATLGLPRLFQG